MSKADTNLFLNIDRITNFGRLIYILKPFLLFTGRFQIRVEDFLGEKKVTWNRSEETSFQLVFWRNLCDFTSLPMKVTENDAYFVFIFCRLCIDSASSYYVVSNTNQ